MGWDETKLAFGQSTMNLWTSIESTLGVVEILTMEAIGPMIGGTAAEATRCAH